MHTESWPQNFLLMIADQRNGIQGKAMLPLIDSERSVMRDCLMLEEGRQRVTFGFDRRVRCSALLDAHHRLTSYDGAPWGELYDLRAGPFETHNRRSDPAVGRVRAEMLETLAREMLCHIDTSPHPGAVA